MELRKGYIMDRWVIIAESRGKRPHQFKTDDDIYANDPGPEKCFFCPGNESMTPEETGRIKDEKGGWKLRWFPNKFAAVDKKGNPEIKTADRFFTYADAYGNHEVIVETPDHSKQLFDLDEEDIVQLLKVYAHRIDELSNQPNIKYVSVFKNEGRKAGTSIVHSHSQLISVNTLPPRVKHQIDAVRKFDSCPYCDIVRIESKGDRLVRAGEEFVTFTPYASRFNFEAWIFPRTHYRTLMDFSDGQLHRLAAHMKHVLKKLKELNASFNMVVYYAPKGEDLHFHIEFLPRIATHAGFELETGIIINSVSPEDAAKFYRGESE
ncbi:galactose-1-phosphate uridylyltransferase [Candidatus Woesearchaeota archaeon]|nr:galactose-1-phosphate uridylyltransferase [Candidatus Woesearchaeota archaeon]